MTNTTTVNKEKSLPVIEPTEQAPKSSTKLDKPIVALQEEDIAKRDVQLIQRLNAIELYTQSRIRRMLEISLHNAKVGKPIDYSIEDVSMLSSIVDRQNYHLKWTFKSLATFTDQIEVIMYGLNEICAQGSPSKDFIFNCMEPLHTGMHELITEGRETMKKINELKKTRAIESHEV